MIQDPVMKENMDIDVRLAHRWGIFLLRTVNVFSEVMFHAYLVGVCFSGLSTLCIILLGRTSFLV